MPPSDPTGWCTSDHGSPLGRHTRLVRLVEWYQRAFEGRPSPCRFTPSCSSYAREALLAHGTARGVWLTVRRLARCRPFGPSGWDPVPEYGDHAGHRHQGGVAPAAAPSGDH